MNLRSLFLPSLVTLALLPTVVAAQVMYRWTDDTGKEWLADTVPPGHHKFDREVVNAQGIVIRREKGETTPEQAEQQRILMAAETQARAEREERERQDRILLASYTTVAAIERRRDRLVEEFDSRIRNDELILAEQRAFLAERSTVAQTYKPYSTAEDAKPMPAGLVRDITNAEKTIAEYEATLERTRADREKLRQSFEKDIQRFRDLQRQRNGG